MLISEKRLKQIIIEEVKKRYLLKELSETDAWAEIVKILGIPPKPTKSQHKNAWNKWINGLAILTNESSMLKFCTQM